MSSPLAVEIAVQDAAGARVAVRAGVDIPSGPGGGADGHDETSADIVAAAVAAARA